MKDKIVKGVLVASIMTLMISCNSKKEEPVAAVIDKEQIKKEIQAKEDEFAATYNAGVLKDIGYYADDATSLFSKQASISRQRSNCRIFKSRFICDFQ